MPVGLPARVGYALTPMVEQFPLRCYRCLRCTHKIGFPTKRQQLQGAGCGWHLAPHVSRMREVERVWGARGQYAEIYLGKQPPPIPGHTRRLLGGPDARK
eukprot:scaffold5678_cov27-Tisochrysis_lutea.AAC.3